jgi:hypothetical protein
MRAASLCGVVTAARRPVAAPRLLVAQVLLAQVVE